MACGRQFPLQLVWRGKGVVSRGFKVPQAMDARAGWLTVFFSFCWNALMLCRNRDELEGRKGREGRYSCAGTASVPLCLRSRGSEMAGHVCLPSRQSSEHTWNGALVSSTEADPKDREDLV